MPTSVKQSTLFSPAQLVYTIGSDDQLVSNFATLWNVEPANCSIEYRMTLKSSPVPVPADPNLIVFDDNQNDATTPEMKVTVSTAEVFYDGVYAIENYNAGVYIVEVRAWAQNDIDTGVFQEL